MAISFPLGIPPEGFFLGERVAEGALFHYSPHNRDLGSSVRGPRHCAHESESFRLSNRNVGMSPLIPEATSSLTRRKQKTRYFVTHPITGNRHAVNTPQGTFHPSDLIAALESVRAGNSQDAVMELVEPYKLDGPNPRPDVLHCIFTAMNIVGAVPGQ